MYSHDVYAERQAQILIFSKHSKVHIGRNEDFEAKKCRGKFQYFQKMHFQNYKTRSVYTTEVGQYETDCSNIPFFKVLVNN